MTEQDINDRVAQILSDQDRDLAEAISEVIKLLGGGTAAQYMAKMRIQQALASAVPVSRPASRPAHRQPSARQERPRRERPVQEREHVVWTDEDRKVRELAEDAARILKNVKELELFMEEQELRDAFRAQSEKALGGYRGSHQAARRIENLARELSNILLEEEKCQEFYSFGEMTKRVRDKIDCVFYPKGRRQRKPRAKKPETTEVEAPEADTKNRAPEAGASEQEPAKPAPVEATPELDPELEAMRKKQMPFADKEEGEEE